MQRKLSVLLTSVVLSGLTGTGFADEAQPELQPKRVEFGWFKKPVEATTYEATPAAAGAVQDYRVVTDFSPL